jgi:hypothetical protein
VFDSDFVLITFVKINYPGFGLHAAATQKGQIGRAANSEELKFELPKEFQNFCVLCNCGIC